MRMLHNLVLAGAGAFALGVMPGGARAAAPPPTHILTVQLPGGGIEQIRYTGSVAPKVVLVPQDAFLPVMASPPFAFGPNSPFAMLQRMSAEMDREAATLMRDASAAFAAPWLTGPGQLVPAGFAHAPVAGEGYGFVASFSGNGVCTRSVTITQHPGQQPQVVSDVSGNCGAAPHSMQPVRQHVTSPTEWRHDTIRVKYESPAPVTRAHPIAWQG